MLQIGLSEDELVRLETLLRHERDDLHVELRRTENLDYHEQLKEQYKFLELILGKLDAARPAKV